MHVMTRHHDMFSVDNGAPLAAACYEASTFAYEALIEQAGHGMPWTQSYKLPELSVESAAHEKAAVVSLYEHCAQRSGHYMYHNLIGKASQGRPACCISFSGQACGMENMW